MASAAVPGLAPTGVAGSPDDAADFDAAVIVDASGRRWRVRCPRHVEASMRLETELLVLRAFVPAVRAELPFTVPYVAGTVRRGDLCTCVYSHLSGTAREIDDLAAAGDAVAADIGKAIAAIHTLPQSIVHNADLPSYTANEFRQRRLNELDAAAGTGKIPPVLLRRWEHALEDVTLWRFSPVVVHGDLHEDNLLVANGRVSAVTGWTDLRVGDPADDFAWLIAAADQTFTAKVHTAYMQARGDVADPHLIRRAALSAEFALAQWMVRGLAVGSAEMVSEATDMLATLEADVRVQEAQQARTARSASGWRPATGQQRVVEPAAGTEPARAPKVTVSPIGPADAEGAAPAGTAAAGTAAAGTATAGTAADSTSADGAAPSAGVPGSDGAAAPAGDAAAAPAGDADQSAGQPGAVRPDGPRAEEHPAGPGSGSRANSTKVSAEPIDVQSAEPGHDGNDIEGAVAADARDAGEQHDVVDADGHEGSKNGCGNPAADAGAGAPGNDDGDAVVIALPTRSRNTADDAAPEDGAAAGSADAAGRPQRR
ncbi:Phosphotransferase enzyme family protein [Arthrobacter saudimassiliensis]|uniref:Phosphotransferase enzyme family protein n=1 Tax=Arthrobacter saudimassiliensis TaxID=1461584 RepID=A0A078MQZ9_9MICC|nr:Phosphotransferase enzyme family protein [Arthrobacter saudimassiliensis]